MADMNILKTDTLVFVLIISGGGGDPQISCHSKILKRPQFVLRLREKLVLIIGKTRLLRNKDLML